MSVAGTVMHRPAREALHVLAEPELAERAGGVEQHVAVVPEAAEQVDLVQERRVLDDHRVGLADRLADADDRVVDAAERDDRRAGPLGAEGRECLRLAALEKRRDRQHLCRRDDALATASVDANLEHAVTVARRHSVRHPSGRGLRPYLSAHAPAGLVSRGRTHRPIAALGCHDALGSGSRRRGLRAMISRMQAMVMDAPGRALELREIPNPEPALGQVLPRVVARGDVGRTCTSSTAS